METYIWIVWCIGAVKSTVLKQLENAESERNSLGTIFEDFSPTFWAQKVHSQGQTSFCISPQHTMARTWKKITLESQMFWDIPNGLPQVFLTWNVDCHSGGKMHEGALVCFNLLGVGIICPRAGNKFDGISNVMYKYMCSVGIQIWSYHICTRRQSDIAMWSNRKSKVIAKRKLPSILVQAGLGTSVWLQLLLRFQMVEKSEIFGWRTK